MARAIETPSLLPRSFTFYVAHPFRSILARRHRRPWADTERSQHDFHCQRAKDESHYTDDDGRALPTDHPQNASEKSSRT